LLLHPSELLAHPRIVVHDVATGLTKFKQVVEGAWVIVWWVEISLLVESGGWIWIVYPQFTPSGLVAVILGLQTLQTPNFRARNDSHCTNSSTLRSFEQIMEDQDRPAS
jgi:hypothetical protein